MRIFFLFFGFVLALTGGITLVAYLNLLTIGYSVIEYLLFVAKRVETYLFIIGILMIWLSGILIKRRKKKNQFTKK
ncbi:hypothetical protein CR203_10370 [Salipaludibacillus neizhouensis]|uniref:Uncharacterized protein n=1 Tax=Salipaludibacillus neizhouensis TaxID=885475 RepID=A0A3A9KB91_9BACI|nr:hypothetical protein [Salipaludibacillus neizhouensis]RKL67741.1 hypothetical protein CR203_10370 [Salipaludibacillus neizhouensis]